MDPNRNSLDLEGSHYHQKSFTQPVGAGFTNLAQGQFSLVRKGMYHLFPKIMKPQ